MLGQFISCDGASAMHDLIRILRVQLAIGKPTPIPKWFNCTEEAFHGGTLILDIMCAKIVSAATTQTRSKRSFKSVPNANLQSTVRGSARQLTG